MAEKPYTMRFVDAVCASELPTDLRHLLMVMAYKADNQTGKGLSGQETIGAAMGCSLREVRRKLDRLAELTTAPVRVDRRPRFLANGHRTSDEYHLVIVDQGTQTTTGRERPPVVSDETTGRGRPSPPDVGVRGSSQGILSDRPHRDPTRSARGAARPRKAAKVERTAEQSQAHRELTEHYFTEFERLRSAKPVGWGGKEGKAVWTLLEKVAFDVAAAQRIVTNGLQSWGKATIMTISGDPSACVAGAVGAPPNRPGERAADLQQRQLAKALQREAEEAAARGNRKVLPS